MIPSRANTTTLIRCERSRDNSQEIGASEALPYLVILALFWALSLVSAVKDPLAFYEVFGRM
jgi:hypothetical protein